MHFFPTKYEILSSLNVHGIFSGFNGGLPQHFNLEVIDLVSKKIKLNSSYKVIFELGFHNLCQGICLARMLRNVLQFKMAMCQRKHVNCQMDKE